MRMGTFYRPADASTATVQASCMDSLEWPWVGAPSILALWSCAVWTALFSFWDSLVPGWMSLCLQAFLAFSWCYRSGTCCTTYWRWTPLLGNWAWESQTGTTALRPCSVTVFLRVSVCDGPVSTSRSKLSLTLDFLSCELHQGLDSRTCVSQILVDRIWPSHSWW